MSGWHELPDLLLETVFKHLQPKDRHNASQVCPRWRDMFYSPVVWHTFELGQRIFTKRMYNFSIGYQRELAPWKVQMCLARVGGLFKRIVVKPIPNFYNLHGFLRVLIAFFEFFNEYPMPNLHTFEFTFACESRSIAGTIIHGTGGKILDELVQLLRNLKELRQLKVNQLLLDPREASSILDVIARNCQNSLRRLELINYTKTPFAIPQVAQFWSLTELLLSLAQVDANVIPLIASTVITQLTLVQDDYSCSAIPVPAQAWNELKSMSPSLRVRLEMRGTCTSPLLLQPQAPVSAVVFSTPYSRLLSSTTLQIADMYGQSLEVLVQEHLPRVHPPRNFHERGDANLLQLVHRCPRLHTLVVSERLSSATLLLIVKNSKSLKKLYVRKNAIIKRFDWPRADDWSSEFYAWLKKASRSFGIMEQEVSGILGYKWRPLLDKEFKTISFASK